MPGNAQPRVYFGEFELDLQSGELQKRGIRRRLPRQSFRVLTILLGRPGEVVTREELRKDLWHNDTFVDFEHGLNSAVRRLREALNDSADEPKFIETLPRLGYRYLGPPISPSAQLAKGNATGVAESQEPIPVTRTEPHMLAKRRRGSIAVLALLVLCVMGVLLLRLRESIDTVPIRSLAVLPIENLTSNSENEYLTDGMTDELITDLVKVGGPRVISRTSVMRYKGVRKSLPEIARELNVDGVVEGTVQVSNGRIHVSVQLVQAQPEKHLWAESYDRPAEGAVALQSELAREIAGAIRISLSPQQRARLQRNVSPEAYQLYLKGRYFWNKRTLEGFKTAIQYFNQAIDKQPDYAAAYAGLADSYLLLGGYWFVPQSESVPKARFAAERALELDSSVADAYATLALIAIHDRNWADAERQFRRAIALNPNYATAHHFYAEYLALTGRSDEALAEIQVAQQLDPLSIIIDSDRGKYLYMRRDYDGAIAQCRKTLEMDPNYVPVNIWLAYAYVEKRMFAESIADLEKIQASDDSRFLSALLVYAYASAGRRTDAMRGLSELHRLAGQKRLDPGIFVVSYIGLGEKERALTWLEKAYTEDSTFMSALKVDPVFDPLRPDPRFVDVMRRVGLAQ